jgi:hypothetical protein
MGFDGFIQQQIEIIKYWQKLQVLARSYTWLMQEKLPADALQLRR